MILCEYPNVFEGIGKFPRARLPYPGGSQDTTQANTLLTNPCTLEREVPTRDKQRCYRQVYLLQCMKQPHGINSFVLVESKDELGNHKLHICLDPSNLNKVITREPYHFRMPDDIAHLLADVCIMTVCDCKKGYWHQKLDQASSYLTTFNTEIGRFRYTVMPFWHNCSW